MDLLESKERNQAGSRHPWELARLEVIKGLLRRHAGLKSGQKVLDIGCGDVFVAECLAKEYPYVEFQAVDVAFTDEMIRDFNQRNRIPNLSIHRERKQASGEENVRVVLLMDVIEHIENDVDFLKKLLREPGVNADTVFLITVPAFESLFCSHDKFLGHYRRYTNDSLKAHLYAAGMNPIRTGYFFFSLLPPRIIQVWKEKLFHPEPAGATTGLVSWKGGSGISGFLKSVLVTDAGITMALERIGMRIPGLSNYAICRKSA